MNTWTVPGYTEVRELGSGASGRVVRAVHHGTGVPVAVKHLSEGLRTDPGFLHTFRGEARLLGALESPYVTRLYEYVEGPEGAAIVMELVDGVALRALLREHGPVGPEAALAVLRGSLLGLAAAHASGVVHRDYKPENVLVTADGSSKLVDFGIAAGHGADAPAAGTPAYMAPEQWAGAPASPAADVYAATATFYECLTGRKPFTAGNFAELALRHLEDPVPEEDVPAPLLPLVRSGMAKAPEDRPREAAAFVAELERIATAAYGPAWEERGRGRLAALAALLPLLFPSADDRAEGTTDIASTALGPGDTAGWQSWLPNGAAVGALCAVLLLALLLLVTPAPAGTASGGAAPLPAAAATTSVTPAGGATPTEPAPSAGATAGASPSAPPTPAPSESPAGAEEDSPCPTPPPSPGTPGTGDPTRPADPGPSPAVSGGPSSLAPPPRGTGPSPERPGGTTEPEGPPTTAPARVKAATVSGFHQTGHTTATATVDIVTDGPGPVVLTVSWAASNTPDGATTQDGATRTCRYSGSTRYTLPLDHGFRSTACYWHVRVSTEPKSAGGTSFAHLLTRRCELR
ncbi:serine/threonine protein kinase [Streptomyces sp. CC210A]|uniref:serine/threonine protein kinase n=1 Tax=Streptomyces sp. CC210A TaxID=2898184 RepID=UPI001F1A8451|nr:serine/threonine protein kinase [Streptomyces sp. CC210A]